MKHYRSYQDYRNAWDKAYEKDPLIPLNIDIELAAICNLNCPFCFISDESFQQLVRQKFMRKDMALELIDRCVDLGVPALKFNWRGESTLHPDFNEIIHYAKDKNNFYDLLINTNANCNPSKIDGLMNCTKVMVSLDSLNIGTYNKMRRGGNLEQAKSIIDELIRRNHPNIIVRRVIAKENEHEDFKSQVKQTWNGRVLASEHYCFDRNLNEKHEVENNKTYFRTYCGYPSQRLVISTSGKAYPCCVDTMVEMEIGTMQQPITEIWHGENLKKLRNDLKCNLFNSKICQNCTSWMAYESAKREYVRR